MEQLKTWGPALPPQSVDVDTAGKAMGPVVKRQSDAPAVVGKQTFAEPLAAAKTRREWRDTTTGDEPAVSPGLMSQAAAVAMRKKAPPPCACEKRAEYKLSLSGKMLQKQRSCRSRVTKVSIGKAAMSVSSQLVGKLRNYGQRPVSSGPLCYSTSVYGHCLFHKIGDRQPSRHTPSLAGSQDVMFRSNPRRLLVGIVARTCLNVTRLRPCMPHTFSVSCDECQQLLPRRDLQICEERLLSARRAT